MAQSNDPSQLIMSRAAINLKDAAVQRLRQIKFYQSPRTYKEATQLIPQVEEIIAQALHVWAPWKEGTAYTEDAWHAIYDRVKSLGQVVEAEYIRATEDGRAVLPFIAYRDERGDSWGPPNDLGDYVAFEQFKHVPGFENNPMEPTVRLIEMGLKTGFFVRVNDEERFVVDFPLDINGISMLGCYLNDDREILWHHDWSTQAHMPTQFETVSIHPFRTGLQKRVFQQYVHPLNIPDNDVQGIGPKIYITPHHDFRRN